jgi:uncharacterized protein (TIGR02453 family)
MSDKNVVAPFQGFTRETIRFLRGLRRTNTRDWFERNRAVYEGHVLAPAKSFVVDMGAKLQTIAPPIVAVPQVNKSIFRLNRDTRFSLDPTPYKTNLGLYFWEGPKPRMEAPGFYVHLEPPLFLLGAGYYQFADAVIARYRKAVVDPKRGTELARLLEKILENKEFSLGGRHYQRVPAGFDPAHPNAELLKHNGLHVGFETRIPEDLYSARLVDYCFARFKAMAPLHDWLVKLG